MSQIVSYQHASEPLRDDNTLYDNNRRVNYESRLMGIEAKDRMEREEEV